MKIGIWSPFGGVGCTTLTASLLIRLTKNTKISACALSTLLERNDLVNYIIPKIKDEPDYTKGGIDELIKTCNSKMVSDDDIKTGAKALGSTQAFIYGSSKGINLDAQYRYLHDESTAIMNSVDKTYNYSLIDIASGLSQTSIDFIEQVDNLLILVPSNLNKIDDMVDIIKKLSTKIILPKVTFVLNNFDSELGITTANVDKLLSNLEFKFNLVKIERSTLIAKATSRAEIKGLMYKYRKPSDYPNKEHKTFISDLEKLTKIISNKGEYIKDAF